VASECNLEPWRRAAFFEESGETYKIIVTTCLKPLEEFTSKIAEALEDFSSDKPELMLQQSKLFSAFDDFQVKLHYVYNYLCCCIFSCELSTVIFVCICSPL
jgi:nucleoporin NDC1